MVMLPPFYPKAEWRPSPNFGYPGQQFTGKAVCGHSTHSPLNSDPPRRFFDATDPARGSVHYWWYGNGHVVQMVKNTDAAYGNGMLNLANGAQSSIAIVREWYKTGRNPNLDTYSHEFCGYGNSGTSFDPITDEQWDGWFRWREWCASEGQVWDETNTVVHKDISATACPDGRFTVADLLRSLPGDDMDARLEEMIWRMADILTGAPGASSADAHGDRLKALKAEWEAKAPLVAAIRNQQTALGRVEATLTEHRNAPHMATDAVTRDELMDAAGAFIANINGENQ